MAQGPAAPRRPGDKIRERQQRNSRIADTATGASIGGTLAGVAASTYAEPIMNRKVTGINNQARSDFKAADKKWKAAAPKSGKNSARAERLRNMANQTKSPHEAKMAQERLKRMAAGAKDTRGPRPTLSAHYVKAGKKAHKVQRAGRYGVAGATVGGALIGAGIYRGATKHKQKVQNDRLMRQRAAKTHAPKTPLLKSYSPPDNDQIKRGSAAAAGGAAGGLAGYAAARKVGGSLGRKKLVKITLEAGEKMNKVPPTTTKGLADIAGNAQRQAKNVGRAYQGGRTGAIVGGTALGGAGAYALARNKGKSRRSAAPSGE